MAGLRHQQNRGPAPHGRGAHVDEMVGVAGSRLKARAHRASAVCGGDGSVPVGTSLGAAIAGAPRACEALCPAQQERRGRCGGDLRGSGASGPANSIGIKRPKTTAPETFKATLTTGGRPDMTAACSCSVRGISLTSQPTRLGYDLQMPDADKLTPADPSDLATAVARR